MKETCQHYAWIFAIAGAVFFINLGGPKLWDRDEPRNAGCAREMLARNDWVVPMFNNELRVHKPVLLYWFMMTAYAVFEDQELAARFWSAVCGLGTALATYHIGRRLFSAQIGLWSAAILSSCMMFPVAARAATPDSVLIFFTTLATLVYVYGAFPSQEPSPRQLACAARSARAYFPRSWAAAALMYALMGMAVLAKGPIGVILPTAVIGMFLLLVRLPSSGASPCRPRHLLGRTLFHWLRPFAPRHFLATCWSMRPLTALAASLAIALPWYVWVGLRTHGDWPRGFFLVHHLQRAMEPMEGHDGPIFYYLVAILLSFFPWSLLLIPGIAEMANRLRHRHPWSAQYVFLACWGAVYVVAFSFASTKLPSYVTPALPAFALLTGCFVERWPRESHHVHLSWLGFAFSVLALTGLGILLGIPIASRRFLPGDGWIGAIGLIPLLGAIAGKRLMHRFRWREAIDVFAITAVVFACALFSFASVRVSRHQQSDVLFRTMYEQCGEPQIAAYGRFEPSWVFYARRPILMFEAENPAAAQRFLGENASHFLITTDRHWRTLQPSLRQKAEVVARVPYFLRRDELLVIRGTKSGAAAKNPGLTGDRHS